MTAPAGRLTVGVYELGERIGAGRIARVHRARGPRGEVALKLLAPDAELDDPAAVARFHHEVKALAAVDHPNVVALLDHGVDHELGPYLVMPLVAGRTLRALIADGPVEPAVAALALRELAAGLAALHRVGLVHRDLKPENVIVDASGRPVILDLGLAWTATQTRYTEEGAIAGSVPYMAPEQIEGGEPTPATDLWALAVIAHEWITGARPFARPRQSEEVAAILAGQFVPLVERDRRVPAVLGELVDRCLGRGARPRDGAEMHGALAALAGGDAAAVLRDPRSASQAEASRAAAALVAEARALLARGKAFAAAERIERAAAHAPDDADVVAVADEVGRAPARRRRARWPWLLVAGLALATGTAFAMLRGGDDHSQAASAPVPDAGPAPLVAADVPASAPPNRSDLARMVVDRRAALFDSDDRPALGYPFGETPAEAAASTDPDHHDAYARALMSGTQVAAGRDFLESSLETFPDHAGLRLTRGLVALRSGEHELADRALSRVIELDPDHVEALRERGRLRRLLGRLRDAFRDLERAHQLAPGDVDIISNLVQIYVAAGRAADARPLAKRAAELAPDRAQPLIDLAATGPDGEAMDLLHRALEVEPRSEAAQKALCVTSSRLGLPQAEDHCFKAGVGLTNNHDPDIVLAKVRVWELRGDMGRAYFELTGQDHDLRLVLKRAELAEAAGYGFALPEIRARACELGHQPSCAADSAASP